MERKELKKEIEKYAKDSELYDYRDCYNNDEEAFKDFYKTLKESPEGILSELAGDITRIAMQEDLRNSEIKNEFYSA